MVEVSFCIYEFCLVLRRQSDDIVPRKQRLAKETEIFLRKFSQFIGHIRLIADILSWIQGLNGTHYRHVAYFHTCGAPGLHQSIYA